MDTATVFLGFLIVVPSCSPDTSDHERRPVRVNAVGASPAQCEAEELRLRSHHQQRWLVLPAAALPATHQPDHRGHAAGQVQKESLANDGAQGLQVEAWIKAGIGCLELFGGFGWLISTPKSCNVISFPYISHRTHVSHLPQQPNPTILA